VRSRYRCSMCPAIHINSRSWLRSSSTREPSDPPLRVVSFVRFISTRRPTPPKPATTTTVTDRGGRPTLATTLTVRKTERRTASGRPRDRDRRLFEPSQCRRRRLALLGCACLPPRPARSSRRTTVETGTPTHQQVFT